MRRAAIVLALLLALPSSSWAAIGGEAFNIGASGTGNLSWTHTPVGTPRGVLIWCAYTSSTQQITTVSYGGSTLSNVSGSPLAKSTGEAGTLHAFFLGSGLPTGAQTVAVTVSGSTHKRCSSVTVTAADNVSVEGTDTHTSDSEQDPSSTVTTGAGISTFVTAALIFGADSINPTAGSGYTPLLLSDLGPMNLALMRRTAIATGGSITYSWTTATTADDVIMMAVAIREGSVAPPATSAGGMLLRGIGR